VGSNYLKEADLTKKIILDFSYNELMSNFMDFLPVGIRQVNPCEPILCECALEAIEDIVEYEYDDEESHNEFFGYTYYRCKAGECDFAKFEFKDEDEEDDDEDSEHCDESECFESKQKMIHICST
jgi:hypothetical protein